VRLYRFLGLGELHGSLVKLAEPISRTRDGWGELAMVAEARVLGGRWRVVLKGSPANLDLDGAMSVRGSTVEALGLLYRCDAGGGLALLDAGARSSVARRGRVVSGALGVLWRVSKGRTRGRSLMVLFKRL
jgi:hypothetical protein